MKFSVPETLKGATILLTGATGYLGSLTLEQLLRTVPDLHKIIVAVRPKAGQTPEERVHDLLRKPIFVPLLRKIGREEVLDKLLPFSLDLSSLGAESIPACDIVIHAAASISFSQEIQSILRENYHATKELFLAAQRNPSVRSFIHVSTAFVNGNLPKGASVKEEIYRLKGADGKVLCHADVVSDLMLVTKSEAAVKARRLLHVTNMPNNYALSKHLAEEMLADMPNEKGMAITIIRPTICCATSPGHTHPGFIGNSSGATGLTLCIALGMFTLTLYQSTSILDIIPSDFVSSSIILAAAAPKPENNFRIIHVGSSAHNPITINEYYTAVIAYVKQHPTGKMPVFGGYPKQNISDILTTSPLAFRAHMTMKALDIKLKEIFLKITGRRALAKKLSIGWRSIREVNVPAIDFNLNFETTNLERLQSLLSSKELLMYQSLWDKTLSWERYLNGALLPGIWSKYFFTGPHIGRQLSRWNTLYVLARGNSHDDMEFSML